MEGGRHAWTDELPERCRGQQQVLQVIETHHQPLQWRAALASQADNTADRGRVRLSREALGVCGRGRGLRASGHLKAILRRFRDPACRDLEEGAREVLMLNLTCNGVSAPAKSSTVLRACADMSSSSSSSAFLGAVAVGAAAGALAGVGLTLALSRRAGAPRPRPGIKATAQVSEKLKQALVVPVVAMQDASGAPALAAALIEGGLTAIEVVFRTAAAKEALRRMAAAEPTALVGAGTVLSVDQAKRAVSAGAQFIVSPGLNPEVVNWCLENGVAVIPGVATPTEVETALRLGLSVLKFFPAEANGGVNALKAISAPYGQITWMPTGGVSEENLEKYLMVPQVACCGGSWMVPQDAVAQGNWRYVKELSQRARQLAQSIALKKRGK
eukprot:s1035_g5.t1